MDQSTVSQAPPQQQEPSLTERHSRVYPDINRTLWWKFKRTALRKKVELLESMKHAPDLIDHLLWRRTLEARLNLLKGHIFLKNPQFNEYQGRLFDLDADINKYSKSPTLTKALAF